MRPLQRYEYLQSQCTIDIVSIKLV